MPTLTVNEHKLQLERAPSQQNSTLQPWDAADELLIHQHGLSAGPKLILNDHFGALACGLLATEPSVKIEWINDSYLAHQALDHNLSMNPLCEQDAVTTSQSIEQCQQQPVGVLIKLPRIQRQLITQLDWLNRHLPKGTPVVIGARLKEMPSTLKELTNRHLEGVSISRIQKKARLIYGKLNGYISDVPQIQAWRCPELKLDIANYPNVYGASRLDIGTRTFLPHIGQDSGHIIDLGCGNGVLGVAALTRNPNCTVLAIDESWDAVRSTKRNLETYADTNRFKVLWNDSLSGIDEKADLVLCNPPFHQQNTITDDIAWQMFNDAHRLLKSGGRLRIVGNRHLGYHVKLKRIFDNCRTLSSTSKFVVLEAKK